MSTVCSRQLSCPASRPHAFQFDSTHLRVGETRVLLRVQVGEVSLYGQIHLFAEQSTSGSMASAISSSSLRQLCSIMPVTTRDSSHLSSALPLALPPYHAVHTYAPPSLPLLPDETFMSNGRLTGSRDRTGPFLVMCWNEFHFRTMSHCRSVDILDG